ncbi:MAG: ATP-binding protein [Eubacteriales bacterium]|nr:ATP-binding protein [Eubacteriales bacterium]
MRTHLERVYRGRNHLRLNKFAAFYGSNGSGKSNFIKALSAMAKIVVFGITLSDAQPFRFLENKDEDTSFETELYLNDKLYSYGFTCNLNKKTIVDEWLVHVKPNEDVYLLKREPGKKSYINPTIFTSDEMKTRIGVYQEEADEADDILLLPRIVKNTRKAEFRDSLAPFVSVYDFFVEKLNITTPKEFVSVNGIDLTEDKNLDRLSSLLRLFDTGITKAVRTHSTEEDFKRDVLNGDFLLSDFQKNPSLMTIAVRSDFCFWILKKNNKDNGIDFAKIQFVHFGKEDQLFDLKDESDGTRRLFVLLDILLWKNDGTTFVVDELDRCLHPNLTRTFVNEFLKLASDSSYRNQLIISTHESTLMKLKYLRRDEIWFVKNDGLKGSQIYPFDQFNERYDKEIEKAYLDGRFGAVPKFEEIHNGEEK